MLSLKEMSEVRLTADSPGYVSVWEIEEDLYDFSNVINKKYSEVYFDFVFCFRALYTTRGIRSKVRFEKDCNCLGMDLIMSLDEFNPYKNNVSMQRRIMGKHFFPFFAENIKKYRNKLPVLKPIEKDLVEDMRLFLIENLWLPDDSGSFKLSVIENVLTIVQWPYLESRNKKSSRILITVKYRTYCGKWTNRHSYQPDID